MQGYGLSPLFGSEIGYRFVHSLQPGSRIVFFFSTRKGFVIIRIWFRSEIEQGKSLVLV